MNPLDHIALRYSAFTDSPEGGNPAGVVLDARGLSDTRMLAIAAEIGYSETAFLSPQPSAHGVRTYAVKYFSPLAAVPFCGHATIAAAVALAEREGPGDVVFAIRTGIVPVQTHRGADGSLTATLTSVAPSMHVVSPDEVDRALRLLRWRREELDPAFPPTIAYAGVRHLMLASATRSRLARLDYDYEGLKTYMLEHDLTTVDLVWRQDALTYYARNPFPVGGVVEDPATGAAAAAFGAYLRELGVVQPPTRVTVLQGHDMGRPSTLLVDIDSSRTEIGVTGQAVRIEV